MKNYLLLSLMLFVLLRLQAQPQLITVDASQPQAKLNGLYELNVQLTSLVRNPFDADSLNLTGLFIAPDGQQLSQQGFFYQAFENQSGSLSPVGEPFWKIRFTPRQTGDWSYVVQVTDVFGSDQSDTLHFDCFESEKPGFVSKSATGNYLVDDKGMDVFLIGENIAWAGYESGNDRMAEYMEKLDASGANFAKLMMTPWSYSIEWGPGGLKNYGNRQDRAFMVDSVFRMAAEYGLYLQLAVSIHNELRPGFANEDWLSNPYNVIHGGPCAEPQDFFTLPEARSLFKNRLSYIIARWGYEPLLMGWELFSEADNFSFYSQYATQIADWAGEMATFIRENDPYHHLTSVGFALTKSNPTVWQHPDIGFTQLHFYADRPDVEGEAFRMCGVYLGAYNKPVLIGEYGIGHINDSIIAWDPEGWALHNGLWATALSGAIGGAVPWFWDAYINDLDLYHRFTGPARFMHDEKLSGKGFVPQHLHTASAVQQDWTLSPKYFDLNAKSPSSDFTLQATGVLAPAEDSLVGMLYGPLSLFANLRNPPVFHGKWQSGSMITVETGPQVSDGILQLTIDGQVVFEGTVQPSSLYAFEIDAGEHTVQLDNRGASFLSMIELHEIVFQDYLPELRAFGMVSEDRALVWVHNRNHHWQWIRDHELPPEAASGYLVLPFYSGDFQLDWYNTSSGEVDSSLVLSAGADGLAVPVRNLETDIALKVNLITSVAPRCTANEKRIMVFPNPSTGRFTFAVELKIAGLLSLEITDLAGRIVYNETKHCSAGGLKQLRWDPALPAAYLHKTTFFLYRLRTPEGVFTGKIILE
ncbi:MAG: DUF5060 domain-containing protein [Bacteroidetes bacterium]|nr:DUF5060 domain-containing protein [Bacteroidota bacterium]